MKELYYDIVKSLMKVKLVKGVHDIELSKCESPSAMDLQTSISLREVYGELETLLKKVEKAL